MEQARRWHRPYSDPDLWVVAAIAVLLGAYTVTPALAGQMSRISAIAIAIAMTTLGLAAWIVHTGLFLGPTGVRIATLWHTATYDWTQIADFVTVRDRGRTRLVLQLVGGSTVPTQVAVQRVPRNRRERRQFSLHKAFEPTRPFLAPVEYEKLVATLRRGLDDSRLSR